MSEKDRLYVDDSRFLPPNYDPDYTTGLYFPEKNAYTNKKIVDGRARRVEDFAHGKTIEEIPTIHEKEIGVNVFSNNSNLKVVNLVNGEDDLHGVFNREIEYVRKSNDKWHVHIPICYPNGKTVKTRVFADPGANSACVDWDWAFKHFRDGICNTTRNLVLHTPGGMVTPKLCIWMALPMYSGNILKAQLYLVKDLPVKLLADINMLKAFGYTFRDETPPIFRKPEEPDLELDLPTQD